MLNQRKRQERGLMCTIAPSLLCWSRAIKIGDIRVFVVNRFLAVLSLDDPLCSINGFLDSNRQLAKNLCAGI